MTELVKECAYIREKIYNSGINFKSIPKEDMLTTCKNYTGKISKENYIAALKVITDLYKHGTLQKNIV